MRGSASAGASSRPPRPRRVARLRRGDRTARRGQRRADHGLGRGSRAASAARGVLGAHVHRRDAGGVAAARAGPRDRRGSGLLDVDRAEVIFRLGCCRYRLTSVATALALFTEALELAERSGIPCDRLRSRIFGWRSRCYRRQRDWEAAREDVERALELAEALDDPRGTADAYFLGALVAERRGQWVAARAYAERQGLSTSRSKTGRTPASSSRLSAS